MIILLQPVEWKGGVKRVLVQLLEAGWRWGVCRQGRKAACDLDVLQSLGHVDVPVPLAQLASWMACGVEQGCCRVFDQQKEHPVVPIYIRCLLQPATLQKCWGDTSSDAVCCWMTQIVASLPIVLFCIVPPADPHFPLCC